MRNDVDQQGAVMAVAPDAGKAGITKRSADVCYWHVADIPEPLINVRYWG